MTAILDALVSADQLMSLFGRVGAQGVHYAKCFLQPRSIVDANIHKCWPDVPTFDRNIIIVSLLHKCSNVKFHAYTGVNTTTPTTMTTSTNTFTSESKDTCNILFSLLCVLYWFNVFCSDWVRGGHMNITPNIADNTDTATESIVLGGNYDKTVGSNKEKFLQECTRSFSSNGIHPVECVDVRPGSIIVDVRGKRDAVTAVVLKVKTTGLALPSFPKLFGAGRIPRNLWLKIVDQFSPLRFPSQPWFESCRCKSKWCAYDLGMNIFYY